MKTVIGKYNTAKVFAQTVEESALEQIREMCSMKEFANEKIRIMPDVHSGKGCTIGTTMTVTDAAVPSFVGVDIGCGMETVMIEEKDADLEKLDRVIHENIPAGFNIRTNVHPFLQKVPLDELRCASALNMDRAKRSLGTLGGGNHFIELDRDDDGNLYLVIHSGSRHAGVETCGFYQAEAGKAAAGVTKEQLKDLIAELKAQGREREIDAELKKRKKVKPESPACLKGQLLADYIHDMEIMQKYAMLNRKAMADEIVSKMGWHVKDSFSTIHNYIDTEHMILRKGSVSAQKGERLLIPINMRDGSLVCTGKGNPDWNFSAPHGAGRLFSRAGAKKAFTEQEYQQAMEGIYTTTATAATLDECPMAYKDMDEIIACIQDTCTVDRIIRPVYNFKASD